MPVRTRVRLLALLGLPLVTWYLSWLLDPSHVGQPVLYGLLLAAEALNVIQAVGFWWTCGFERVRRPCAPREPAAVDVFVPRYDEPVAVVELTIAAAAHLRGGDVRVWLLDDGDSDEMRDLAARHGIGYLRRPVHDHAKAGNVNHALARTDAPYVAIVDCDHVVQPEFLDDTLGHFEQDERLAFVQTPQYYANGDQGGVAGAAWAQQTLFFGAIARGKDGLGATFCCGTNVVFRRAALEEVGGFPTHSVTEDFELSIELHERGWHSAYLPKVLARGLGPEDMSAYITQQLRWARGCLSALPRVLRARLPWRLRAQYLLSALYWMSGWTVLVYMSFPLIRILLGIQPLAHLTAPEFLLHFAPYFGVAVATAALAGTGAYTFAALALAASVFWVHIVATVLTALRRKGSFKVTPKQGATERQLRAVAVPLAAVAVLVGVSVYGLVAARDAATFNNAAFAGMHVTVLLAGSWPALRGPRRARAGAVAPGGLAREAA
jgi:cellulose synthase (UDP-forming)